MTHKQGDEVWVHRGMYVQKAEIFASETHGDMYCIFPEYGEIISIACGDIFTDRLAALKEMRDKLKQALKITESQRAKLKKIQAEKEADNGRV